METFDLELVWCWCWCWCTTTDASSHIALKKKARFATNRSERTYVGSYWLYTELYCKINIEIFVYPYISQSEAKESLCLFLPTSA